MVDLGPHSSLLLLSIQGVQRSNSALAVQRGTAEGVYVHGADKGSDCFVCPGVISAVIAGKRCQDHYTESSIICLTVNTNLTAS